MEVGGVEGEGEEVARKREEAEEGVGRTTRVQQNHPPPPLRWAPFRRCRPLVQDVVARMMKMKSDEMRKKVVEAWCVSRMNHFVSRYRMYLKRFL